MVLFQQLMKICLQNTLMVFSGYSQLKIRDLKSMKIKKDCSKNLSCNIYGKIYIIKNILGVRVYV